MEYSVLNNNVKMPKLGFGVYQIPAEQTKDLVLSAIKTGYRLIDTAGAYQNEVEVGQAIQEAIASGLVTRDELFVTTKLWMNEYPENIAKHAIQNRLENMQLDYIDLLLVHQPYGDIYGAWRAMSEAVHESKLHAIGVSNFSADKIVEFSKFVDMVPQINQIEINPWYQRDDDISWHDKYHVQVEAWAPFAEGRLNLFQNNVLQAIGNKYNKSIGQIVTRWLLQRNIIVLTKSVHDKRIRENFDVFDFILSDDDMYEITQLDKNESSFFDHRNPEKVEQLTSWSI